MLVSRLFFLFAFLFHSAFLNVFAQTFDHVGSGRAILFDGQNDQINLGNIYDDLSFPISVEFWLKADPSISLAPIFVSQDNLPYYNGFWIGMTNSNLFMEFGDGLGENSPYYRKGVSADIANLHGRWIHVCGVMYSDDHIELFINGNKAVAFPTGGSTRTMNSDFPDDEAKIGTWLSNGAKQYFKGELDELRIWKVALTDEKIKEFMCQKYTAIPDGIVGWWDFDETSGNVLYDKSGNGYHGTLLGSPQRVFSGAPIGDKSKNLYNLNMENQSLVLDNLKVLGIDSDANGVHIYSVNSPPSQTGQLNTSSLTIPYYGVFIALEFQTGKTFDIEYLQPACNFFGRESNAVNVWNSRNDIKNHPDRIEILINGGHEAALELGPEIKSCANSVLIETSLDVTGLSFRWNTGETGSSIEVSKPGRYTVEVQGGCGVYSDFVDVTFLKAPENFSLGNALSICAGTTLVLQSDVPNSDDYRYIWQDGTTTPTYQVTKEGTYILRVQNDCGESTDQVVVKQFGFDLDRVPNVITPNSDSKNEFFILPIEDEQYSLEVVNRWGQSVYFNASYNNNWSPTGLSPGVYFWRCIHPCLGEIKGTVSVLY